MAWTFQKSPPLHLHFLLPWFRVWSLHDHLAFALLMLRLRRQIFRGQQLNTPDWNFQFHLFHTLPSSRSANLDSPTFYTNLSRLSFQISAIGRCIQTCTTLFCVIDSWQVVGTPSVQDYVSNSEASDDLDEP